MDLLLKFRKDYFNYLISIVLPALITGISIPVFKNLLGAKSYGNFSIWFNAILILTAILSGWISQSIILFYPLSTNKHLFSKQAIILSVKTLALAFIPVLSVIWYLSHDFFLAMLCSFVLFVTCIQFSIIPIIQSIFLSKKIILSELIRVITYITCAVLLLKISGFSYLYSLFFAVIASYTFSLVYLIKQAITFFETQKYTNNEIISQKKIFKSFFKYGAPLSMWFVFAYLLSYVDKLFMLKNLGGEAQGNYQAIFDLLSKGIIIVISPIVRSLFPILTAAYAKGNNTEVRKLLKKIILYEIGGFFIASLLYWSFGASLLFFILKTPDTFTYRLMGFIVLSGTFIWQIAILVQKRFELKLRSFYLLIMVIIAFSSQILFYILLKNNDNYLLYPLGFLVSALVYLFLVSISELVAFKKPISLSIDNFLILKIKS